MNDSSQRRIPVSRPYLNDEDREAIQAALLKGEIAGGDNGRGFEDDIALRCGRSFGVAVTNGTDALKLALRALNLAPGSKVLIPAFTIISVLLAVRDCGLDPVFIDVCPESWNVTSGRIEQAINDARPSAAIVVQTYAAGPQMHELAEIFSRYEIPWVEDAAEGFGGSERDRAFGSFGTLSTLSFYVNKLVTTGEGGMILGDDRSFENRLRSLRNMAFDPQRRFQHNEFAGNHRMANLNATLGRAQARRAERMLEHRRALWSRYQSNLFDLADRITFQKIPANQLSSAWAFGILIDAQSPGDRRHLMKRLLDFGIETRHFFFPLDDQPLLGAGRVPRCTVSANLSRTGLYLPLGNGISIDEVDEVCTQLKRTMDVC